MTNREPQPILPLRHPTGRPLTSTRTLHRATAVAEALFSRDGIAPPPARIDWLRAELEDFLARSGTRSRVMLATSIWLLSWLAPLSAGRLTSIERLGLGARVAALTRLEERFPPPVLAVKALLCLLYYEHPDAAREVGFDGECALPRGGGSA